MIAYIRGRVLTTTAETIIVDVGGVGYELYCSGGAFSKAAAGGTVELYTYLQMKEDGMTLFGFASPKEKELFLKLTSVSGVGPKLGIAVLSALSADDLAAAIATADVKRLSTVKGLGKKTAERIILELREKVTAAEMMGSVKGGAKVPAAPVPEKLSDREEDAIVGLMSLGYTRAESVKAVKGAIERGAETMEEIIMTALKNM